jgi:hypothetical protein
MPDWTDVVTTALLGTDRRPVPSPLPTSWGTTSTANDAATTMLELAAQHRVWSRAGSRLAAVEPPAVGPPLGDLAPAAAQELLGRLLETANPALINAWLAACVRNGQGISPDHWQPLAVLASAAIGCDPGQLARALGPRGRWFLAQNPEWTELAHQLEAALALPVPSPPTDDLQTQPDDLRVEIERAFAADPDTPAGTVGGDDIARLQRTDIPRDA